MKTEELINYYGSQVAVARLLGVTKQYVNQWGKCPPCLMQWKIQNRTNGQFKVCENCK